MSKIRETLISNCEKNFVLKSLEEYRRLDGRAFDEFRELTIEFGKDWGCCFVSLGKTRVVAQVSCEIQEPKASRPSEGILYVNVELTPMGAPHFEAGRQSELSVELNRTLEKCIKDSRAVDLEALCIKISEKVWAFRVDVSVLNHEGNIIDCASVAAIAALAHFRRPDVTFDGEEFVVHSYTERDPIPTAIHHYPVCVSYVLFNNRDTVLADPTLLEEGISDAHLILCLNAYKELCGLHLGGSAFMQPDSILQCSSKAAARAGIVIEQIKKVLEKDKEDRSQNKVAGFDDSVQFSTQLETSFKKLSECLDTWTAAKKKKKKAKAKVESMEVDQPPADGVVESLGKSSVAYVPNEGTEKVWNISSEESDDDVVVLPTPKPDPVEIDSNDSEEDAVVVLNANNAKSHKRKKGKTQ